LVALREEFDLGKEIGGIVDHVRVELVEPPQISIGEQPPEVVADVEIEVIHIGNRDIHLPEGVDRLNRSREDIIGARLGRFEHDHVGMAGDGVRQFGGVVGQSALVLREDVRDIHTQSSVSADLYPDVGIFVYPAVRNGRASRRWPNSRLNSSPWVNSYRRCRQGSHVSRCSPEIMIRRKTVWQYARWLLLCVPGAKPQAMKRNVLVLSVYLFLFGLVLSMLF